MKRCLVLAFVGEKDLPLNHREFDVIDAYGKYAMPNPSPENSGRVRIHSTPFSVETYQKPPQPYNFCYVRHPNPQVEPRSWAGAIAALGECLDGSIFVRFYYPYEILQFAVIINTILGNYATLMRVRDANFETETQIEQVAEWHIQPSDKDMRAVFEQHQDSIVHRIWQGDLSDRHMRIRNMDLEEALKKIAGLP
jgi:hypothetical protein